MECAGRAGAATALSLGVMWAEGLRASVPKRCRAPLATAVQDAGAFSGDSRIARSVLECAGFSGAVGRTENLERWMISVRTKSGAEVTATSRRSVAKAEVQALREFRSVAAFGRKPPSEK
jgi:hypothetical protein